MADIYVDASAATNGSGSESSPRNIWPTGIGANDRIFLKRGTRLAVAAQLSMGGGSNNLVADYGDASAPRPIITSTATNQSLLFVDRAGVTSFRNIHFDQCLNMASNGGVIGTGAVAAGRHANLSIIGCKFTGTGHNAILLNGTNTANAPSTFECIGNEFDDIGADCVFGAAINYVFAHNRCTNLSSRTVLGDGVGFINGDPDFIHIHHNYIDHSLTDCKQCIIVDTTTPGTGRALIEDNILIGYGSATSAPSLHSVIISDPVTTIRRNLIYTYGLTCGINNSGDRVTSNVIIAGNSNGPVAALVADGIYDGNTFVALSAVSHQAIVMGTGATASAIIKSNLFLNFPTAVQSNIASNPTMANNAYRGVTTRRTGQAGAFSEATEVTADANISASYRPMVGSNLLVNGPDVYRRDRDGRQVRKLIGAYGPATLRQELSA